MSSEEIAGQRCGMFSDEIAECDVCGQLFQQSDLLRVGSRSPVAEHSDDLRVCHTCWNSIERGELDLEDMQQIPEADRYENL